MHQRAQTEAFADGDEAQSDELIAEAAAYAELAAIVDDALDHVVVSPYLSSRRKRMLDLVVGLPLALAAVPVIGVAALASAISFRAWPIFTQMRLGQGGHPFRLAKIRSLPTSAPKYTDKYTVAELGTSRVGRFLRKSKVDELPQLWLVVTGEMSLVGPRPEMQVLCETFDPAFIAWRLAARPGCAGLWQISEDSHRLIGEVPQYDLAYLERASLRLDLSILWHTARVMLGGVSADVAGLVGAPVEKPTPVELHTLAG